MNNTFMFLNVLIFNQQFTNKVRTSAQTYDLHCNSFRSRIPISADISIHLFVHKPEDKVPGTGNNFENDELTD